MKFIKAFTLLIILAGAVAFMASPALRSEVNGLLHLSRESQLLGRLEESHLLPPPLPSAIDARNAFLTQTGTLEWTNYQRKQDGLQKLKLNPLLNQAAQLKLSDMFKQQYFEHESPSGVGPSDLADEVGYAYVIVGENLALGNFENDQALVEAWMNSPGHRENILNDRYEEIGIAVGKGLYEGREVWLAVQSFGTPLSSCPSIDEALKTNLDNNQTEITALQAQLAVLKAEIESTNKSDSEKYNAKVKEYNNLVEKLNSLINVTKEITQQYNSQVNSFNACLKQ
ncbi:MAG: hypothetical protein IT410_03590 [Candidatus Doudnabacteria bacterium]|nr:hypothetical protein [Candidatus Doudnabacteria bacterium]